MDSERLSHLHFIILSLSKLPNFNRQHFLLKSCSVEINYIKAVFFTPLSTAFDVVFFSFCFRCRATYLVGTTGIKSGHVKFA